MVSNFQINLVLKVLNVQHCFIVSDSKKNAKLRKKNRLTPKLKCFKAGVPNLGDASPWGDLRGLKSVIFWVLLYQWGHANGLREDTETKRLGTPDLDDC